MPVALAALLLQATAPLPPPPLDPLAPLKESVVEAIRNCGVAANGEIRVCSRDRGFAEIGGANRLPRLVKPKPIPRDPAVTVQVTTPDGAPAPAGAAAAAAIH